MSPYQPNAQFLTENGSISMWYQSHECGLRIAMFYSVAVAANSFNGLIGNAILKLDGVAGLEGWSWLFIIEGTITFCIGTVPSQEWEQTARISTDTCPQHSRHSDSCMTIL